MGCETPPPFLSILPLESMRSGGAIPPLKKGIYLSDACAIPSQNKAKRVRYSPLRCYLERVFLDGGGGVSRIGRGR